MKKVLMVICMLLLISNLTACNEPLYKISCLHYERVNLLDEYDCIAVYTQYENLSDENSVPADEVSVKAFQNGVELSPIVPTGDKTNGFSQCDIEVQAKTKAKILWYFQLDDESKVSIEMTGRDKIEVDLKK